MLLKTTTTTLCHIPPQVFIQSMELKGMMNPESVCTLMRGGSQESKFMETLSKAKGQGQHEGKE